MAVALAVGEELEESFATFWNNVSNLLPTIFCNSLFFFYYFVSMESDFQVH